MIHQGLYQQLIYHLEEDAARIHLKCYNKINMDHYSSLINKLQIDAARVAQELIQSGNKVFGVNSVKDKDSMELNQNISQIVIQAAQALNKSQSIVLQFSETLKMLSIQEVKRIK